MTLKQNRCYIDVRSHGFLPEMKKNKTVSKYTYIYMGGWKILEIENDKLFGMKYGTSDFMSRLEIDTLKDFK